MNLNGVNRDEVLEDFKNCKTVEEVIELASKKGIDVTKEEVEKFFSVNKKELTEEELGSITGGTDVIGVYEGLSINNLDPHCIIEKNGVICGGHLKCIDEPGEVHDCLYKQYNNFICEKCYTKYIHIIEGDCWKID